MSPELVTGSEDDFSGLDKRSMWDIAVRYQDLKRMVSIDKHQKEKIKAGAIEEIIRRAHDAVSSIVRPSEKKIVTNEEAQALGVTGDMAIEETIEHGLGMGHHRPREILYEAQVLKKSPVVVVMDASLSMTGEKIALLAVAAAVIAMSIESDDLAMAAFASKFRVIKRFDEVISLPEVVSRVLEIPSHGLTNLELALENANVLALSSKRGQANVVLISDGKYTEGKDPAYLGHKFKNLQILKIGKDIAGRELLNELVRKNRGSVQEVRQMRDLPKAAYKTVRSILRS
jgi:uncharacterized protein YegL